MFNCTNDTNEIPNDDFIQLAIPDSFKTKLDNNTDLGKSQVEEEIGIINVKLIDDNGEEVFGKFRFTMPNDDAFSLSNLEVTKELIEKGGITKDYFKDHFSSKTNKEIKNELSKLGCFGNCKKNYKRGEGRGVCRAECWFNILIKVIPIVIAILK